MRWSSPTLTTSLKFSGFNNSSDIVDINFVYEGYIDSTNFAQIRISELIQSPIQASNVLAHAY